MKLTGRLNYIDKYGRAVFDLDEECRAAVIRICRDATLDEFPVRCRIPPHEFVSKRVVFDVAPKRYSFVSKAAHNAGQTVAGVSFRLVSITSA